MNALQNPFALLARLLLAALFLPAGISKISGFAGTAGYIGSVGLPMPELGAAIAIAVEVLGGIALIIGFGTRWAALALAVFTLVASNGGADGSVHINADAAMYAGLFDGAETAKLTLNPARKTYVHLVRGSLDVNGETLQGGDAAVLAAETQLKLANGNDAEVLVFDLAA